MERTSRSRIAASLGGLALLANTLSGCAGTEQTLKLNAIDGIEETTPTKSDQEYSNGTVIVNRNDISILQNGELVKYIKCKKEFEETGYDGVEVEEDPAPSSTVVSQPVRTYEVETARLSGATVYENGLPSTHPCFKKIYGKTPSRR